MWGDALLLFFLLSAPFTRRQESQRSESSPLLDLKPQFFLFKLQLHSSVALPNDVVNPVCHSLRLPRRGSANLGIGTSYHISARFQLKLEDHVPCNRNLSYGEFFEVSVAFWFITFTRPSYLINFDAPCFLRLLTFHLYYSPVENMKASWCSFLFAAQLVVASPRHSSPYPPVTSTSPYEETASLRELRKRQTTAASSVAAIPTCGYVSGNADLPVTGSPGDYCAIDTVNALWGICPTTAAIGSSGCSLAAFCVDVLACSTTCPWQKDGGTTTTNDATGSTLTWYVLIYSCSSYSKTQTHDFIAREVEQTSVVVSNISVKALRLGFGLWVEILRGNYLDVISSEENLTSWTSLTSWTYTKRMLILSRPSFYTCIQ